MEGLSRADKTFRHEVFRGNSQSEELQGDLGIGCDMRCFSHMSFRDMFHMISYDFI